MSDGRAAFASRMVLELASGFGPAMLAAKLLADLGCPVFKVEPLAGDPLRATTADDHLDFFTLLCGSKDSLRVDLHQPGGREALDALLVRADIVVVDRDGIAQLDALYPEGAFARRFPAITLAVCTPFGMRGSLAGWRAGEEGIQAMSGIMSTTGHPGRPPSRVAGAIVTHAAAMYAVASILADLRSKAASGGGARLDLAMFDAAISLLTSAFPAYFLSGSAPQGLGNRHSMAAPWNTYRCRDGWVVICAGNEPTWQRLVTALARPDLAADPAYATQEARVCNVDALDAEVERWTERKTAREVEDALDAQGIPCGPILPLASVMRQPQFATRGLLRHDAGVAMTGGVFHRNGQPLPVRRGRSGLGQGTRRAFVEWLRVDPVRYERWRHEGAVLEDAEAAHVAAA